MRIAHSASHRFLLLQKENHVVLVSHAPKRFSGLGLEVLGVLGLGFRGLEGLGFWVAFKSRESSFSSPSLAIVRPGGPGLGFRV